MAADPRLNPVQLDDAPVWIPIAVWDSVEDRGQAVPFDVIHHGQPARGFLIKVDGSPHAYLNRCTHVPMELDWQPNQVFDLSGRWLLCATHGALYQPDTGACRGGPCRGGLVTIPVECRDGVAGWLVRAPFCCPTARESGSAC